MAYRISKTNTNFKLLFYLFMLLMGPKLSFGNFVFDTRNFVLILFSAIIGLKLIINKKTLFKYKTLTILLLLILIYYTIIISINGFKDIMGFKLIILSILNIVATFYLYKKYEKVYRENAIQAIMDNLLTIFIIDSIFVLLVYFNSNVWNFAFNYLGGSTYEMNRLVTTINDSRRSFDIGIGAGAVASINFAIFFCMSIFCYIKFKNLKSVISIICLFSATVFLGRTGLILEVIMIIVFTVYKNYIFIKRKNKKFNLNSFRNIVVIFIILIVSFNLVIESDQIQKFKTQTLPWVLEMYYQYIESGEFSTKSTENIINSMFFLPDNTSQFIFGNSNLGRSDNMPYIPSDVGYIRTMHGFGIFGTILTYMPLVYLFIYSFKSKNYWSKFISIAIVVLAIVNMKELHLLNGNYTILLFMIYFYLRDKFINHRYLQI